MYLITKTYGHDLGLSACFRQPLADTHCRDPHGYALSFKFTFGALMLDPNNWVLNFGGLKPLKEWLCENFDHRTILAEGDPLLEELTPIYEKHGFAPINVLPFVGCEGFASYAAEAAERLVIPPWDRDNRGLRLVEVEVREHGANSAIWRSDV